MGGEALANGAPPRGRGRLRGEVGEIMARGEGPVHLRCDRAESPGQVEHAVAVGPVEAAVGKPLDEKVPGTRAAGREGVERGHGRAIPLRIHRDVFDPAAELGRSPPVGCGGEESAELDLGMDPRPRLPEELEHKRAVGCACPLDDQRRVGSVSPEGPDAEIGGRKGHAGKRSQAVWGPSLDGPADKAAMEARHGAPAEGEHGDRRSQRRLSGGVAAGEGIDRDDERRARAIDDRDGKRPRPRHLQEIDDADALCFAVLAGKPAGCGEPGGDPGREVGKHPGTIVAGFSGHGSRAPW